MSSVGRRLLSAVIASGNLHEFIELGLTPVLFKDSEAVLFNFMMGHAQQFGVIPSQDTIEEKLGDVLTAISEPAEYYAAEVERRYLHDKMKMLMIQAGELLKTNDPEKAYKLAMGQLMDLHQIRNRHNLYDFKNAAEVVYQEYMYTKSMPELGGLLFGWDTLDDMTGGLRPGDVCSIVGRPAQGKTFKLLYMAERAWASSLQVPLFVSMEMGAIIIQQRLAAMNTHKNLTHLIKGMMTTKAFNEVMTKLNENAAKENSFWVVDSNLSGAVDDIVLLCRQLKPSAVFVDGAYMLEHSDKRLDKFGKISANAELLKKKIAGDCKLPVVASYQMGRTATKKGKKKDDADDQPGLEDIYGSDTIGQVSSVVLGLLQKDSVETKLHRDISILKGRNGETGKFKINWDFINMDFSEVKPEEVLNKEMQYIG